MLSFDCNQAPVVLSDIVIPFIALQSFLVPFCTFSFGQQQFLLVRGINLCISSKLKKDHFKLKLKQFLKRGQFWVISFCHCLGFALFSVYFLQGCMVEHFAFHFGVHVNRSEQPHCQLQSCFSGACRARLQRCII